MKMLRLAAIALAALAASFWTAPALALGPVNGEVTALYWGSDTDLNGFSESSGDVAARAELWLFKKWGVSAGYFQPSPDGADMEYLNLDAKYRVFAPTDNNFIALGVGWQTVDFSAGEGGDTAGPRVVAEGRFSVKIVYFYGRVAYLPKLDDIEFGEGSLTDGAGQEFEAGIQIKPFPFFQIFAGYRADKMSFDAPEGGTFEIENKGPVAGIGFNF